MFPMQTHGLTRLAISFLQCSGFLFGSLWPYRLPVTERPIGGLLRCTARTCPGILGRYGYHVPSTAPGSSVVGVSNSGSQCFSHQCSTSGLTLGICYTGCLF